MNIKLGTTQAMRHGLLGFLIPASIVGLIALYHFSVHDIHPIDREKDIANFPMYALIPSLGLAFLFALSAFATFTYASGLTFMRSLAMVSFTTLIAVLATRPRMHFKTTNPNAWLEIVVPVVAAVIATAAIMAYNRSTQDTNSVTTLGMPRSE